MECKFLPFDSKEIPVYLLDTVVVGSGCAGLNAADCLHANGVKNIAIVTEGLKKGTSRNTGSDKQTYYKLSLAGAADSVAEMAQDLFACGGVHGDTALAEAANSAKCFLKLANLGVGFPTDVYGQYVGYKTDHDPRQRASSAGPLTSKFMTQALEAEVLRKKIPVLDGLTVIRLLVSNETVQGLLCVDRDGNPVAICAGAVVLATGGPAICYADSVYPHSQTGMSGLALQAGAVGANLNQWQYGLASTKFRWNVSGTYQQVLPRYISVDEQGVEREFLPDYLGHEGTYLDLEFLKGYQWPFDSEKQNGSSMVDMIVYHESVTLGRRVFLDFRRNPTELEQGFDVLGEDAYLYLKRSDALFGRPIDRLNKMNPQAIDLYKEHGIDLYTEPLEIAVCAQHHNGGIAVDANWQSTIERLYVVGEAAGTFGIRRPGGSALNSTQVGSLRVAEHIAYSLHPHIAWSGALETLVAESLLRLKEETDAALAAEGENLLQQRRRLQRRMSDCAAQIRDLTQIRLFRQELSRLLDRYFTSTSLQRRKQIARLYKNRDMILSQIAVLHAIETAAVHFGSYGGALVLAEDTRYPLPAPAQWKIVPPVSEQDKVWLETAVTPSGITSRILPVRPIPTPDDWFENVWAVFRKTRETYK